jgi:hypothetical protein
MSPKRHARPGSGLRTDPLTNLGRIQRGCRPLSQFPPGIHVERLKSLPDGVPPLHYFGRHELENSRKVIRDSPVEVVALSDPQLAR